MNGHQDTYIDIQERGATWYEKCSLKAMEDCGLIGHGQVYY
jgi:hypothetical protein